MFAFSWARAFATGSRTTKAERLAAMKAERNPNPSIPCSTNRYGVYGDTALHRFVDDDEWVLEVWVRQNGVARRGASGECREALMVSLAHHAGGPPWRPSSRLNPGALAVLYLTVYSSQWYLYWPV